MSNDLFAWLRAPGWAALAGAAALLTVHTASAQECDKDADCGDGYVCKSYGMAACPATEPAMACAPGEKCPDPQPAPDCTPTEVKGCAAAPCEKDSDCPDDMACIEHESGGCTSAGTAPSMTPACKPGEDCPQADEKPAPASGPPCMVEKISECTPHYALPCEHDADCGAGFTCKEQFSTSCSGSSGTGIGGSDPGAGGKAGSLDAGMAADPLPPPEKPVCSTESSGVFMCELVVVECETNADCPASLECQANPNRAACASAGTSTSPAPTPVPMPDDNAGQAFVARDAGLDDNPGSAGAGGAPDDPCAHVNDGVPERVCAPHNYYAGGRDVHSANDLGEGTSAPTLGGGKSDESGDPGAPVPAPQDGNGGQGGATSGGAAAHSAADADDDKTDAKASDDGCAVAAPGSDSGHGLGLLAMLGMSALLVRRRSRRARLA